MLGLNYPCPFLVIWWTSTFFVAWCLSYEYLLLNMDLVPEVACRIVTASHALIVTIISALAVHYGPNPFTDIGEPSTLLQEWAFTISLSYFIFDLIWCLIHQTEGCTMLVHHIISIAILSRILFKGYCGAEAAAGLFCMEITNPLLQARWFTRASGHKESMYYTVLELTFIAFFIIFRLGFGTYLLYCIVIHPKSDFESKLSALSLYALSWVFMCFIVRYVTIKYILSRESTRRGSVLPAKTIRINHPAGASTSVPIVNESSAPGTSGINTIPPVVSLPNTSVTKEKMQ